MVFYHRSHSYFLESFVALRPLQLISSIAAAILIGVLVTWGIGVLVSLDLGHQWRLLPKLPTGTAEIVTIWQTTVYVRSSDGQLFSLEPERDKRWTAITTIPTTDPPLSRRKFLGTCDQADERFRWTAIPPHDIRQCLEARTLISVAYFSLSIIQDTHDQLWFFQTNGSDFAVGGQFVALVCFILSTLFAFIVLRATIISMGEHTRRRSSSKGTTSAA